MDPLQPLIDTLHADGRPRVWSLVITVFGDSVQHRGGHVPTVRLSRLLGRIGIETGALRTALSRLARDGWVDGTRHGRSSSYTLTQDGQSRFGPATQRIYAAPRSGPVAEWVFLTEPVPGALRLAGGSLCPAPATEAVCGLRLTGRLDPGAGDPVWQALEPGHRTAIERLAGDLRHLEPLCLAPLDAAAARTLLIHRWRRLVLRWPDLPMELTPETLEPRDLHRAVARAYHRLTPAAEAWLDAPDGDTPAMPRATRDPMQRFRSDAPS